MLFQHPHNSTYIVFKQPWGEHEWDECGEMLPELCASWHGDGVELVSTHDSKKEAERAVRRLNGWD